MKLKVLVKPRSNKSEILSYKEELQIVRVAAIPHNQESNKELIRTLSDFFNVSKSKISIVAGHKSKTKTLAIDAETEIVVEHLKKLL